MFATLDETLESLKTALNIFPYGRDMTFFMCARDVYYPTICKVIKEQGLRVLFDDTTVMKFMRKEDAKKFDVV